jgi:hypothetical protein
MRVVAGRGEEVGSVGFDEDAVGGKGLEEGALGGFAFVEEIRGEGEMRAAVEKERC